MCKYNRYSHLTSWSRGSSVGKRLIGLSKGSSGCLSGCQNVSSGLFKKFISLWKRAWCSFIHLFLFLIWEFLFCYFIGSNTYNYIYIYIYMYILFFWKNEKSEPWIFLHICEQFYISQRKKYAMMYAQLL